MTKTLTEKWRDGTLPCGAYYVNRLGETRIYLVKYEDEKNTHEIYEILAPVPSYDEWQESQKKRALWFDEKAKIRNRLENKIKLLEEQLNCALETMGQVAKLSDNTVDAVQCAHAICLINERLKEIKEVK